MKCAHSKSSHGRKALQKYHINYINFLNNHLWWAMSGVRGEWSLSDCFTNKFNQNPYLQKAKQKKKNQSKKITRKCCNRRWWHQHLICLIMSISQASLRQKNIMLRNVGNWSIERLVQNAYHIQHLKPRNQK